jgi:hypothetical protein
LSPALATEVGLADLTSVRVAAGAAVTVAVEAGEVTVPPAGVVPDTVAELLMTPLSMSAWVAVYVKVQVVVAAGARVVAAQVIAPTVSAVDGLVKASATARLLTVTLPLLVTAKEYVTLSPALATEVGLADFTRVSAAAGAAVTVAVEAVEVTAAPTGGVPVAVAELLMTPLSMSAWVTV